MAKRRVCTVVLAAALLVLAAGHAQDDTLRLTQGAVPPGTEGLFHLPPALGICTEVAPEVYSAWDIDV